MSRLSEHDEFMAEEARAMDHACRVAAKRGYFIPGPRLGPGLALPPPKPAAPACADTKPTEVSA